MTVSFACKNVELKDIIKCSFNLNKTEYELFLFLIKHADGGMIKDISKMVGFERSTVQKALKALVGKKIVERIQRNNEGGGYSFYYRIIDKGDIKKRVLDNVDKWQKSVKNLVASW